MRLGEVGDRWRSVALSTRASHRRQVGATGIARELDEQALQAASDSESRADALIGLAADAVAAGAVDAAAQWHAEAAVPAGESWRTRTRWHWVGAELALLDDDRDVARAHAVGAVASCPSQAPRHRAKSRIIHAAVTADPAGLVDVAAEVGAAAWRTLEWPLALVAADHATSADEAWLARAWDRGIEATYFIEEHLPEGLIETWRCHPGVRRLRAAVPSHGGE
jgi:hypothetical protein